MAFDPEQMDAPTVNCRGGWYYLIDGQHRIAALKQWLASWEDQQVQCWCYDGLTEAPWLVGVLPPISLTK